MNADIQQEIWSQRAKQVSVETVLDGYRNPCAFQREFAVYLNRWGKSRRGTARLKVCEIGSEFGVTTLLLDERIFERHALDLNARALELLSEAAQRLGQQVQTHVGDMFQTSWVDETFDVVFNNGVLEHYSMEERIASLKENARVTRKGGGVMVGVPNHCSAPYRIAYLSRRLLGRWPYPPEAKIADLAAELAEVKILRHERTIFFDQEMVFAILPRARVTAEPFRVLHRLMKFQPYLRVFEMVRV